MSSERIAALYALTDRASDASFERTRENSLRAYRALLPEALLEERTALQDKVQAAENRLLACIRSQRYGEARETLSRACTFNAEWAALKVVLQEHSLMAAA